MEKTRFITNLNNLFKIARKDKWTPVYNRRLDFFSWTKPTLSKESHLVKVSHDVFLYFNSKGLVEGLAIEYLTSNFIEHNPSYKDLPKIFTKEIDEKIFTVPKKEEKQMEDKFEMLTETLKANIYEDSLINKQDINDLERLIKFAIKS